MIEEPDFINPSPAHAVDLDKFFQRLDRGLTVNLINTPRDDLEVCRTDMVVGPDLEHNTYRNFDFLPVFEGDEIVGLLDRVQALTRKSDHGRPVKEVMAPLGEPNLIAARAGVRDFIRSADTAPARLVIDGTRVSGIVTIADLQKLPVRVALFSLITHLELLITEYVSNSLHQMTHFHS
jgi:predicted transcriptional regulator